MTFRRITYFLTASLTVLSQSPHPPATTWETVKLVAAMLTGGLIALRALESEPDKKPETSSLSIK